MFESQRDKISENFINLALHFYFFLVIIIVITYSNHHFFGSVVEL